MDLVREVQFTPDDAFPQVPQEQARAILRHLDLEGAHFIVGRRTPGQMIINRASGAGTYRITWQRDRSRLIVERQRPFSAYRLMHFLHFRHGYGQPYVIHVLWAAIVDAVTISMWLWVVTGIYIWFRRPRQRIAGGLCVAGGSVLFIALVAFLCL